jgi:F-type H+-transporting ATPase subunit b
LTCLRRNARQYKKLSMRPSRPKFHVRFETAPDLISGIELTTNGQKIAWSIADYLASLEKGVGELLKEKDKPEAKAEPKAKA